MQQAFKGKREWNILNSGHPKKVIHKGDDSGRVAERAGLTGD